MRQDADPRVLLPHRSRLLSKCWKMSWTLHLFMAAVTVTQASRPLILYCLQDENPEESIQRMVSHFFIMLLDQLFLQVCS